MEGYTLIKYFQEVPQKVKIGSDVYNFYIKAQICAAWVKNEHVNTVLNLTRVCCGGNKTKPYRVANEADIRRWSGISER